MLSRKIIVSILSLVAAIAVIDPCAVDAKKNRDVPHPHSGVLKPYQPGAFDLKLDSSDEKCLEAGKPVMKQSTPKDGEVGGGAICVQDVDAPREAVWSQILDYDKYKGKVAKVNEAKNYVVRKNSDGTSTVKTKMVLGVLPGYSYTAFYDHTLHPKQNSVVWTLDYEKTSDFDDVAGHWHVEEHPTKPGCTRLFYACDIKLAGAVPKPIVNILSKSALKTATSWVKKNSEQTPEMTAPSTTFGFGF
eukprot:CAMPEP_0119568422 /NCGR_PEP_ID=MMETSP1352-20130426/38832_1 /TAXON_ID=265584 /ORGANISM="Stauroneis constricta, Strain CCMP1120" /LENGTH=245 /DNA_ID=CAMNT_0007617819 /DNA_START=52 /DNA_END=789 /DNA_ORIENTATION=+